LGHQFSGGCGNARQPHGQIQGGAFSCHQCRGGPLQLQQAFALSNGVAVLPQQTNAHPWIKTLEELFHQRASAEPARLLGDPMGRPLSALQRGRC
jgi:hypothetical protein